MLYGTHNIPMDNMYITYVQKKYVREKRNV